MSEASIDVVLRAFKAVEMRDAHAFADLAHPEIEFCWPPVFPYGSATRAPNAATRERPTWESTWTPVQPTEGERRMDPRVVAASDHEVVVLWHQRGVDAAGERFDGEVLGLYEVRDGKLARAQMFYFDPAAALDFLIRASNQ